MNGDNENTTPAYFRRPKLYRVTQSEAPIYQPCVYICLLTYARIKEADIYALRNRDYYGNQTPAFINNCLSEWQDCKYNNIKKMNYGELIDTCRDINALFNYPVFYIRLFVHDDNQGHKRAINYITFNDEIIKPRTKAINYICNMPRIDPDEKRKIKSKLMRIANNIILRLAVVYGSEIDNGTFYDGVHFLNNCFHNVHICYTQQEVNKKVSEYPGTLREKYATEDQETARAFSEYTFL